MCRGGSRSVITLICGWAWGKMSVKDQQWLITGGVIPQSPHVRVCNSIALALARLASELLPVALQPWNTKALPQVLPPRPCRMMLLHHGCGAGAPSKSGCRTSLICRGPERICQRLANKFDLPRA